MKKGYPCKNLLPYPSDVDLNKLSKASDKWWEDILDLWNVYSGNRPFPRDLPTDPADLEWFSKYPDLVNFMIQTTIDSKEG